ncbi:MAG: xylulokinase [Candidatus Nanopelagicales bacterium]|jgi:xylulokinase|nr:xylulokinase [Candidatus Nanopelagicales bacterium]MDP5108062.1 xylulokinase [Candidatus Nanopelagicales bacterium]
MTKKLVAGVDSSTQSVKIVVRDAQTGELIREARASHPDGTEIAPSKWLSALNESSSGLFDGVQAISIGAQQHGMVVVDQNKQVVRDALLWNDTRSASDATDLVNELGGADKWADAVGSVPVASFTVTKLRWLAKNEPNNAAKVNGVMLPHDWLSWQLMGTPDEFITDRGDASGTGYWSPKTNEYRKDLLKLALGKEVQLPRVAKPNEIIGQTTSGISVAPGTGDNMAAALGLGASTGDIVISLGTSGTAYTVSANPTNDSSGIIAGFADATGNYLPLACTLNAARVINAGASALNVSLDQFAELALSAQPGSEGLVLLPFLDGERTPNLPTAKGSMHGLTRNNLTPANFARACIEGMLCSLAEASDVITNFGKGTVPNRVVLIGGAAASKAVQEIAATLFKVPIHIPPAAEYVADGAARQAAWALSGSEKPPAWEIVGTVVKEVNYQEMVRNAYRSAFEASYA